MTVHGMVVTESDLRQIRAKIADVDNEITKINKIHKDMVRQLTQMERSLDSLSRTNKAHADLVRRLRAG